MKYQRMLIGYHSCTETIARAVLDGEPLLPSHNDHDWLGHGIYFWEYGFARAIEWGNERARILGDKGATLGAVIETGNCFDLLDTRYTKRLRAAYPLWQEEHRGSSLVNLGLARRLDCAFFNWYFTKAEKKGRVYDTVRAAFHEGQPLYPNCGIVDKSHIQIVVRNPAAILGVFRPT
jgi:hypothetical protein